MLYPLSYGGYRPGHDTEPAGNVAPAFRAFASRAACRDSGSSNPEQHEAQR
jgi:hypothetical protein